VFIGFLLAFAGAGTGALVVEAQIMRSYGSFRPNARNRRAKGGAGHKRKRLNEEASIQTQQALATGRFPFSVGALAGRAAVDKIHDAPAHGLIAAVVLNLANDQKVTHDENSIR
jgi:hypothetical protein